MTQDASQLRPLSKPMGTLVGVLCLGVMLSALAGSIGAGFLDAKPAWPMLGMELVVAVCAGIGLGFFRGAYREGTGIALASIAGSIFLMSGFTYVSLSSAGTKLGSISVKPLIMAHVAVALVMGLIAAGHVLSRRPGAWTLAVKGVALLLPPMVVGVVLWKKGADWVGGVPAFVVALASVAGALVLGGMFCVGVDFVINAFEMGRGDDEVQERV